MQSTISKAPSRGWAFKIDPTNSHPAGIVHRGKGRKMEYLEGQIQQARIHSKAGKMDAVKVLTAKSAMDIVVEYQGRKYTAVFNGFAQSLYVDDIYGLIEEEGVKK